MPDSLSDCLPPHPDSPLAQAFTPSPNHGERRGPPIDAVILHYTGMKTAQSALDLLCDPASEVSCHYFIWEDGRIFQLVAENRRAWHAGKSMWQRETDMNSRSIGIEIVNQGHDGGLPQFPDVQIAAVIALCQDLMHRHAIPKNRILAHSDIAPARKIDPGELFPWRALYDAGVAEWVEPAPITEGPIYEPGALGPPVAAIQTLLAAYGYGLDVTGQYDETTRQTIAAFQRRFRPALIDGQADRSTVETLRTLLRLSDEKTA